MATLTSERVVPLDGSVSPGKDRLGGKADGIVRMRRLGLRVPPAFTIPVTECRRYHQSGGRLDEETWQAVLDGLRWLEQETGRRLGDPSAPLLVSVRSGAPVSMPGMMDTVLNLGMTDEVERALADLAGDPGFARDTHTRFCAQFGKVVLGADVEDPEPGADADSVRAEVVEDSGREVPREPLDQLREAIDAVFASWRSRRAIAYRKHWGISDEGGTAVTVQAMVFGNLGEASGTGVFFTRDPLTGAPEPYGEWLPGGQGEDVVSGTHAVQTLADLAAQLPDVHAELLEAGLVLERENGDVQDIEFTVERGRLFLLQTRSAKRSPAAAVRTAVDFAEAGLVDRMTALQRVTSEQVASVLQPRLAPGAAEAAEVLARGEPACPGVAAGVVVGDSEAADAAAAEGRAVVLVRPTTSPEDISGMIAARAVVTELGGSTSHAAVVTRALGRPCVVGVGTGATAGWSGREVTVDATAGVVYAGRLPTEAVRAEDDPALSRLLEWAREASPVQVVDEPPEGTVDLDASGVGLDPSTPADPARVAELLRGANCARGTVVATPAAADAVLDAGVPAVAAAPGQHPLVLLLHLLQAASRRRATAAGDGA
ncbi:pyruvate, orthophosphate dikinase [Geodermatophilus amargosae]|uniref:Pyruvate, orthophosphate dikinase n=1 Tax=Geodermatophilus amargosae TaxID=1296565 RepID=A0A1I7BJT1_9ACTN|nr:pyruvate, phosphate dikinase [Geodermatophilus amargosae]SFT87407.1 pyruvate, orthophosphate dikinase [Geodermatophilus amargosae]